MNEFVRELGGLTVFVLCAQFLISFRPKESYEKYFQLLLNLLILLLFLIPVRKLIFGTEGKWDLTASWKEFEGVYGTAAWDVPAWDESDDKALGNEDVGIPGIVIKDVEMEPVTLEESSEP